jgi:16S rRNA (uracil1498-N3)-methyltransferase
LFLFYTTNIEGSHAILSEEEARHCTQVLRKKVGDTLHLVDGNGLWAEGTITELSKKICVVSLTKQTMDYKKPKSNLHIAIAPTKNMDRLEWFMEKATEIGITEISLIKCARSERTHLRHDRLSGILVSAMKQSLKAYLPKLNEILNFSTFVGAQSQNSEQKFIAYCNDDDILELKTNYIKENNVIILIGPEGDFTPEEVRLAIQNGFVGCSLGKSRLRTETAGLVACHTINLINN